MANTRQRSSDSKSMTTLRLTASLKARLGEEAARNGRALSQEIEQRLERSFLDDDRLGGPDEAAFLRVAAASADGLTPLFRRISVLVELVEMRLGKSWNTDDAAMLAVLAGIRELADKSSSKIQVHHGAPGLGDVGNLMIMNEAEHRSFFESVGIEVAGAIEPLSNSTVSGQTGVDLSRSHSKSGQQQ